MKHTIACAALAAALVLGAASAAAAQTSPPPAPPAPPAPAGPSAAPPAPPAGGARPPGLPDPGQIRREIQLRLAPDGGARALDRAYRTIGEAEALNGRSPYIGQARGHYAGAYARFRRGDAAGTVAEASAAAALAQAALDERAPAVPRGLEAPPSPAPRARPAGAPPPANAPRVPGPPGLPVRPFDASSLQPLVALENTAEVRSLADRAAAAAAAARALAANDRDGARRQERLAHDLALAVRGITAADHPDRLSGLTLGIPDLLELELPDMLDGWLEP